MSVNVLLVEDDTSLAQYVAVELRGRGRHVTVATSLAAARNVFREAAFEVIVLDRMLPDGDGLDFLANIRDANDRTPVLVLSALDAVTERVEGLRRGGDDYLVKPFDVAELDARLEVLTRRARADGTATRIEVGDLSMDLLAQRVARAGAVIRLQPREFRLLEYLARNAGQIVTRSMLLEAVWGLNFDPQTNVVDVHVSRLRRKLDSGFGRAMLETVRGKGYRLVGGD